MSRWLRSASMIALLALAACGSPEQQTKIVYVDRPVAAPPQDPARTVRVPLFHRGGTPHAMVGICVPGGKCVDFPFMIDSGASDTTIDAELFSIMVRGGLVTRTDVVGVQNYQTASGVIRGLRFRMPVMTIGNVTVNNVVGSVSPSTPRHTLLIGQSFLRKFKSWSIDNSRGELVLAY